MNNYRVGKRIKWGRSTAMIIRTLDDIVEIQLEDGMTKWVNKGMIDQYNKGDDNIEK